MIERRKAPRTKLKNEVIVRLRASLEARVVDVSPGGALLELGAPLRPSLECDLRFPSIEEEDLRVRARVHRCRLEKITKNRGKAPAVIYRAGVEFLHGSEDACERTMIRIANLVSGDSGSLIQLVLLS